MIAICCACTASSMRLWLCDVVLVVVMMNTLCPTCQQPLWGAHGSLVLSGSSCP